MQKKLFLLFGLLILSLYAIASCARVNTIEYPANDFPLDFDWNLPTAVSAGIELYQLASLTDEEIRLLHQPHIDIANSISLEFGVNIEIGTADCYFMSRDDILYAIANISLAETDLRLRELAEQLRRVTYVGKVFELIQQSGYNYILVALIDAFDREVLDPVEVYYRLQQDSVISFFEEIQYTLSS